MTSGLQDTGGVRINGWALSGNGEGRMSWFTQFDRDKNRNQLEIENYSSEPVRLNELRLEPIKK